MPHTIRARTASVAALAVLALLASVVAGSFASSAAGPAAALPDKTLTRSNPENLVIPELGPAIPATSPIVVEPGFGRVTDVDVTLTGLFHACPGDLAVSLTGPGGQSVVLMRNVTGCHDEQTRVELTFDDEAAEIIGPILPTAPLASGSYKPTDGDTPDPAPVLSVFDGQAASGHWQLAVEDVIDGDGGYLTGWSIEIDYNDAEAPAGRVSVGGGAAVTGSPTTSLTLTATDANPGTGVAQMRFSNDGSTWSAFRPYAATSDWTLSAGDGTKTVWAQFTDGIGNLSAPASDTIVLDTTAPTVTEKTPKNKKATVSLRTSVSFVASEALDVTTLTRRTVRLTAHGATLHAKVSYAPDTRRVTVSPQKRLAAGTTYKVKVSPKVTDLAGNGFVPPDLDLPDPLSGRRQARRLRTCNALLRALPTPYDGGGRSL